MKKIILLVILGLFSHMAWSNNTKVAPFVSFGLGGVMTSSSNDDLNSMSGVALTGSVGYRMNIMAPELMWKSFQLNSKKESGVKTEGDSSFIGIGGRLFFHTFYNVKAGIAFYDIDTSVYVNDTYRSDRGYNGSDNGIYGGMGANFPITEIIDIYTEASFYTASKANLFFIELEGGARFYLW